jgi:hypothetical protein
MSRAAQNMAHFCKVGSEGCESWCPWAVALGHPGENEKMGTGQVKGPINVLRPRLPIDSNTGQTRYRTLKGEDFLWLVLAHVLPKGFRRVRDYGFLHGNARKLLVLIQLTLKVMISIRPPRPRPVFKCPRCQSPMHILGFIRPAWASG